MAFTKKTWKDRIAQYLNRRRLTDVDTGDIKTVTVTRDEGGITEEGDIFNAATMNDLENRINTAFTEVNAKTGSDIAVSDSDSTSIADMFVNNGILLTKESNIDTFEYACRKVGKVVSLSVVFTFSSTPTDNQTIASNLPAPTQQLQIFVCCVAGTNVGKVSRARISNTGLLTDWYSSSGFFKTGDTYLISSMYLSAD